SGIFSAFGSHTGYPLWGSITAYALSNFIMPLQTALSLFYSLEHWNLKTVKTLSITISLKLLSNSINGLIIIKSI
ncbi:hypothetical protein, partial [Psychrobacter namhaensis]|uniref:hypothetical protein n=1 Tax=Psychrobacter namhaensis TaxID=292734 RepID=UPI003D07FE4C